MAVLLPLLAQIAQAAAPPATPWRTLSAEELAMTAEPAAPGAPAIYLYTQVDWDDNEHTERVYHQIKVLTEQGRARATLDIPYRGKLQEITDLAARVVQPDGVIVPYAGTPYERPLLATGATGVYAKSVALADVRVGSIIEIRYTRSVVSGGGLFADRGRWMLTQDLYTRQASYSLVPAKEYLMRWVAPQGLPTGAAPLRMEAGVYRLDTQGVPAVVGEPYMPPAINVTRYIEFSYTSPLSMGLGATEFWQFFAASNHETMEKFIKPARPVRDALKKLLVPQDTEEQKVRRIYDHVQNLRNLSLERPRDEKEAARARQSSPDNINDIARRGEGTAPQLVLYFVGLLRAAGLEAHLVLVGRRNEEYFLRESMNPEQLKSVLALVRVGGKQMLLNPASRLPFGMLDWFDTAADGLRIGADGGKWVLTPDPRVEDAVTRRQSQLRLGADGVLEGTVNVTWTGYEAVVRRMQLRLEDDVARRKYLEDELKLSLPDSATVKLLEQPDWDGIGTPLQAKFQLTAPDWAVPGGSRLLVGLGLFGATEKRVFVEPERRHPIAFTFPFQVEDEIHVELPPGFRVESTPPPTPASPETLLTYHAEVATADSEFVVRRKLLIGVLYATADKYPTFRQYFQKVRAGDEQQVILAR